MNRLIIANYAYSSWSFRAWLLAKKSGIPFEFIRINLGDTDFDAKAREYSPSGRLPALLFGKSQVWDSLAIAETLAEAAPNLLPSDFDRRAWVRSVCAEMHSGFTALRSNLPMNCRANHPRYFEKVRTQAGVQSDVDRIQQIWTEALTQSKGPWLLGHFSVADAFFAPVVSRFATYGVPTEGMISTYIQHVLSDADVQEWYRLAKEEVEVLEKYELK